jgi:hypothetical protein
MKFMLHEIRFLLAGLAFGFACMPAILWYADINYDIHLFVYHSNTLDSFYREIYTRLDDPQVWFYLLAPYLLLRLTLLLFRSTTRHTRITTPVAHAAVSDCEDMVRTLITQGSDINTANRHGQTPLHLAADQGNSGVARTLLELGAMVDVPETASGYTPLHYAAGHGHTDLCELLIRYGADPDTLTGNMESPLHLAIEKGRTGVVGVLLKYHARLDIKNSNGLTPLQQAENLRNSEIVNLINQHLSETWPYLQMSHR